MKSIVIVGAGIGGCTTYLFLKKHLSPHIPDLSIHIYESYPPPPYLSNSHPKTTLLSGPSAVEVDAEERPNLHAGPDTNVTTATGGALGLSPNGVRVFESLDHDIFTRIKAASIEVEVFGAQVSSGRMLGNFNAGGPRYGHGTLMIMRAALHDAVLEKVDHKDISFEKKVRRVVDAESAVAIEFEDGSSVEADLIIGADGVWGRTRGAIPESAGLKPEYDGLVGIGAFLDEKTTRNLLDNIKSKKDLVIPKNTMTMTFGSGAFFGTVINKDRLEKPATGGGGIDSNDLDRDLPFAGWWSTFPIEPAPMSRTPFSEVKDKVLAKHKGWTPLIPALIASSGLGENKKGTFVLPRWITPSLPKWTSDSGRVLLLGDAAHCMPPDSGQGVSCAVEDAMTLGLLCQTIFSPLSSSDGNKRCDTSDQDKLKKLCDLYTKIRKPRCEHIVAEARKRGNMKRELNWWEEALRNVVIFGLCKILPESMNDGFFSWDVATEVKRALKGEIPSVKGKGRVVQNAPDAHK